MKTMTLAILLLFAGGCGFLSSRSKSNFYSLERIPPAATLITTITATIIAPTCGGAPVTVWTARPAP